MLFNASFAVFWALKEVIGATNLVQTPLDCGQSFGPSSRLVPMQMAPSKDKLDTQIA